VQIILVAVTTVTGYFILKEMFGTSLLGWIGAICGLALGYVIIKAEEKLKDIPLKTIVGSLTGLFVSLVVERNVRKVVCPVIIFTWARPAVTQHDVQE